MNLRIISFVKYDIALSDMLASHNIFGILLLFAVKTPPMPKPSQNLFITHQQDNYDRLVDICNLKANDSRSYTRMQTIIQTMF